MNVLFICPKIADTFWGFKYALEFLSKKAFVPPLGLLTVASMVPKSWNKRLVDMNVRSLTEADLEWADYAFISAMQVQKQSAEDVIKKCKEHNIKIVAGGPYFSASNDNFDLIDHLVLGEAETTLPLLIKDLEQGSASHIYHAKELTDLSLTPVPDWSLININDYDTLTVQYSRGCPYDCEFCEVVQLYGRKQRIKDTRQFIREIDAIYESGWRGSMFIVDDNFIGVKPRVKEMLRELAVWMERNNRPFCFCTEVSINLAEDEELMTLMADAGFIAVFVGIETPNKSSLEEAGKSQNLKTDLLTSVKIIQERGFEVMGGFIVGFDHDTEDIFDRQIDFIQKSGIMVAMVGLLTVPTGTKLWKRLQSEGRLLGEFSGNNNDIVLNYIPKMDRDVLINGYRKVVEAIYDSKAYYERSLVYFKNFNLRTVPPTNASQAISAFGKSFWRIGIKNEEGLRKYYWLLLLRTLITKPALLGDAIRIMVIGLHFRKTLLTGKVTQIVDTPETNIKPIETEICELVENS